MEIRVRETGQVMFDSEWRRMIKESQGLNFGQLDEATLNRFGADVVFEGPQATGGTVYQYSMRQGVEQVNSKWYTKYVLGPVFSGPTAAEDEAAYQARKDAEQADQMRADRNKRLTETDWTQLADSTADKEAWATYRQALRDVPTQAGFPWEVTWPTKPE